MIKFFNEQEKFKVQRQNDLAENLLNLFEPSSYQEFEKGYFVNKPNMQGYFYIFKRITKPKFCLIVNTSEEKYPTSMMKIRDYVFIVFNVSSLEEFLQNLTEKYFVTLMDILDNELQKKNTRNLPYGFYTDENGDLKVDLKAAAEVRKIYDMYIDTQSIRDIAAELRTNFSDIREILHDSQEYMQMRDKIVSLAKLKQVTELMAANVRGGAAAKRDTEDELADARRRRKENQRKLKQIQQ
jgi:hypothetical protein